MNIYKLIDNHTIESKKDDNYQYLNISNSLSQIILFIFGHYIIYYLTNYILWQIGLTNHIVFVGWWYMFMHIYSYITLKLDRLIQSGNSIDNTNYLDYFLVNLLSIIMLSVYYILGIWPSILTGLGTYLIIRKV